jgi:hypothetical protein
MAEPTPISHAWTLSTRAQRIADLIAALDADLRRRALAERIRVGKRLAAQRRAERASATEC